MNERDFYTEIRRKGLEPELIDIMHQAFEKGYETGLDVEEFDDMDYKLIDSKFANWYEVNFGD